MKNTQLASLALAITTSLSIAGGKEWMTDFEAAKAKAAKENKNLLVDFTGSDWCHWCTKLVDEVFKHDAFKNGVKDKFILVELDYPNDKSKLDEKTIKQNEALHKKYPIPGFPTILLMDADGRPFAQTGYQDGGPEKYVAHLDQLLTKRTTRDKAFKKAETTTGIEKAKILYEGLQIVPESYRHLYLETVAQIIKLDPQDETGLAAIEKARKIQTKFENSLNAAMQSKNFQQAITIIDKHIADQKLKGGEKQQFLSIKLNALIHFGQFDKVDAVIDELIAIDPEARISKFAEGFRKDALPKIKKEWAEREKQKEPATEK